VRVAGDVGPDAFAVDGVHDVVCSTTDGGEAGDSDGPVTECTFTFTGDVNDLVTRLGEHRLVDLDVEEAPLEEVFMRFYGETDA